MNSNRRSRWVVMILNLKTEIATAGLRHSEEGGPLPTARFCNRPDCLSITTRSEQRNSEVKT